jgi:GNAT superfamily N-acetyltransferase
MYKIEEFQLLTASDAELRAFHTFRERIHHEFWPEDQPAPLENTLGWLLNKPDILEMAYWMVWNEDHSEIIAVGEIETWRVEENQHLAQFGVDVLPEYRRQGIGDRLLTEIVAEARRRNRRLLMTSVDGDSASGIAWLKGMGAKPGLETHTNQLDLMALDRNLIQTWIERTQQRPQGFSLETIIGPYPEDQLEEIAHLMKVMNDAPTGELDIDDEEFTPEQMRQWDASMVKRGLERWHMQIRDNATGELAGFTVTAWNPYRPDTLMQWGTGVQPKYRGLGLGRWLKAAMLDKVLRERPQVQRVRTGNADANAPMLKINYELGFKPYKSSTVWQVEVAQVETYLAEQNDADTEPAVAYV